MYDAGMTRAVGYIRVSTDEQADSGLGLDAQRSTLRSECARRGWDLVRIAEDAGASGKSMNGRPALTDALQAVETGQADTLVVAKLDRLSRSLLDFAGLMERAHRKGWSLVALDLGVDTTTPAGELIANVMATFAQYERKIIGQRTTDALKAAKARGVRLGRPRLLPAAVARRIVRDRDGGATLTAIAEALNAEGVPTAQGGRRWYPSTVRAVLTQQQQPRP